MGCPHIGPSVAHPGRTAGRDIVITVGTESHSAPCPRPLNPPPTAVIGRTADKFQSYICTYLYIHVYIDTYIHIFVHIYLCIYIYIYIHVHLFVYLYTYMHIYIYMYLCTNICIYKYTNTHIYIFIEIHVYMHVKIYAETNMCIYIYIYIYITERAGGGGASSSRRPHLLLHGYLSHKKSTSYRGTSPIRNPRVTELQEHVSQKKALGLQGYLVHNKTRVTELQGHLSQQKAHELQRCLSLKKVARVNSLMRNRLGTGPGGVGVRWLEWGGGAVVRHVLLCARLRGGAGVPRSSDPPPHRRPRSNACLASYQQYQILLTSTIKASV